VGTERDCEKSLLAAAAGWHVIALTTTMLRNNPDMVRKALAAVVRSRRMWQCRNGVGRKTREGA
jgi:very-short-patch-repair endonuclease